MGPRFQSKEYCMPLASRFYGHNMPHPGTLPTCQMAQATATSEVTGLQQKLACHLSRTTQKMVRY